MHGTAFWAKQPPQFLVLQLCGKDCDKQHVESRCSLAIWPDFTPSWVRMSGGKSRVKNCRFWMEEHELKNCEKLLQNIVFFFMLSCQNTVNTSVFGWFALRTENKKMKKTVEAPCWKNIAKHSVFYTFAKTVWLLAPWVTFLDDFRPWRCKNNEKSSAFSSKGINMSLNTVLFDVFGL